jgi:hydrogenase 3 maturation protease
MLSPKRELKIRLKGAKRVAVLGVGSLLCGDDALGLVLIEETRKSLKGVKRCVPLKLFSCGATPENYTGEVKKFRPSHILIVDALDMGETAGKIVLTEAGGKSANVSFSTHALPMKVLANYLIRSLGCRIICIGIQPKTIGFSCAARAPFLSDKVHKSVKRVSGLIIENVISKTRSLAFPSVI